MNFQASLDNTAKVITVGVTLLFVGIIGFGISGNTKGIWVMAPFLVAVYVFCWLLRPLKYTITNSELQINRPIGKTSILKSDIKSIGILQESSISGAIRTFGVGGLFGYYGKFYNSAFGSMSWYLTQRKTTVLVTTQKSRILLSPDEPERFAETLRKIN